MPKIGIYLKRTKEKTNTIKYVQISLYESILINFMGSIYGLYIRIQYVWVPGWPGFHKSPAVDIS